MKSRRFGEMVAVSCFAFIALCAVPVAEAEAALLEKPGLIDSEWLAERLDEPSLRIIDARSSLGDYLQTHIPGAIYLNTETLRLSEGGVPARLLSEKQIADIFSRLGIGSDHTVVVYSSSEDLFAQATYVAYLLEWLGHAAIGVLDGGIEKWRHEDRPVIGDFPRFEEAFFLAAPEPQLMKTAAEVAEAAAFQSAALLDARPPQAFAEGHIPTARSYFLQHTLTDNENGVRTWKSPSELQELAAAAGADGAKPIITYCTSGRQSSQIWFGLRYVAGLPDVSSYDGSWIDWISTEMPVAKP